MCLCILTSWSDVVWVGVVSVFFTISVLSITRIRGRNSSQCQKSMFFPNSSFSMFIRGATIHQKAYWDIPDNCNMENLYCDTIGIFISVYYCP